jgi:ribosomal protein S18 acetylase RimI-like enzyme
MDKTLSSSAWLSRLEIRTITQADLPALEWNGEYKHFRRLYWEIYQNANQGKAVMWAADLFGKGIIGQLFVQLNSARKELADGLKRAYLYGFRIQEPYRRAGVGSLLLKAAEADLVQRKYCWLTLNVGRENTEARHFYEQHGYQVVADEPGRWSYLDDQGNRREVHEPAWRMEKSLGLQ